MRNKILAVPLLFCVNLFLGQTALSDPNATIETRNLFKNLSARLEKGYFVGHQDDLAYGVSWKYEKGRSDVRDVTGDYPAVYGWELGDLELGGDKNLDGVPFKLIKEYIRWGYEKGSIITIGWHMNNLLTGRNAWDPAPGSVQAVLPGGSRHEQFKKYLDTIAEFLGSLKGKNGEAIPVLWRPWHETTGGWFWWGTVCSDEQYKELFRFSADYLRKEKNLHNLIIGYNTGTEFRSADEFLKRYPGDDYVDIVSFDAYQRGGAEKGVQFGQDMDVWLGAVAEAARAHNKLAAVGELGYSQILDPKWFTTVLGPVFEKHKFSYVLFWRNAGFKEKEQETEYYIPFKGHPAASDFLDFYKSSRTFFQSQSSKMKLYR